MKNEKTSLSGYQEAAVFLQLLSKVPALRLKEEKILSDFANYVGLCCKLMYVVLYSMYN